MNMNGEDRSCANCRFYREEEDRRVCILFRNTMSRGRAYPVPQSCCGDWKIADLQNEEDKCSTKAV